MKNKVRNVLAALVLCMSAVVLPVTAYASTGSDTTPPTLTAALTDDKLAVEASDDLSGVEAVYVDGTRINSLVNGKGTVALKDYAGDPVQYANINTSYWTEHFYAFGRISTN